MSEQQLVALIKELAERETGNLLYRPAPGSRPVHRRRLALLAAGTCATVVAAVVAVVALTGSGPSALAPGYATTSPSLPSWFAPSVEPGPSSSVSPGVSDNDGPRVQALAAQVRARVPQVGSPTGGYEITGPAAIVRVHFSLPGDEFLTAAQEQLDQPLDMSGLLQGFPETMQRPLPYELADGVQMLVLGGSGGGTIYAVSPTGLLTTLRLDVGRPSPVVAIDDLRSAADDLTRITMGLASPSGVPTGEVVVPNVLGFRLSSAVQALAGAGLALAGTTSSASSSAVPPGVVIAQAPQAGSHVRRGTSVKLTLNSGPG